MEKLIGSISTEDFIRGLLLTDSKATLGSIWEKCATCSNCLFAKQCHALGGKLEDMGKNPRCGQIIDMLLGELKPEDVKTIY